jgi:hypothetical protein
MRIIAPTDGTVAAERRLAAWMLCMEHGCLAYGPDLAPLPPPHEPWPRVALPPLTDAGLPVVAHYRPAVGLVFYTAGEAFRVAQLVERLNGLLARVPEDHLRGLRAVAATPVSVLRHKGRVGGGTVVVGPRKPFEKPGARKGPLPARLLLYTPEAALELPCHFSVRAAFTWVFMPVTAALAIRDVDSMAAANALIASLLYDAGALARRAEGADFFRLSLEDFDLPGLPPFLAPRGAGARRPPAGGPRPCSGSDSELLLGGAAGLGGAGCGALVVSPADGSLSYVGQHLDLRAGGRPADVHRLPLAPWDPAALAARDGGPREAHQCCVCDAPLGGDAVLVEGARAPLVNPHRGQWAYFPQAPGAPLLPAGARQGLLLCLPCWGALGSADCLPRHMEARVSRTVVPGSQALACAACPGFEGLAPLLDGCVRPVPGAPGAFVVQTRADGPGAGAALVLAGEKLGPFPALTAAGVAALRLPVVAGLRLAELRAPWGPPRQA